MEKQRVSRVYTYKDRHTKIFRILNVRGRSLIALRVVLPVSSSNIPEMKLLMAVRRCTGKQKTVCALSKSCTD
jgi:hypothetical protein